MLTPWKKSYDKPKQHIKKQRQLTKVHIVKAMVFPVVMYGCESWTVKKAEHRRIDAFELWCWRRLLRIPWTARRFNQSILKEISPGISLEGMMLQLTGQPYTEAFELIGSVQFSHSVVSDSLQPHGLQHSRLPCPSPTPRACSNSCPSSPCWHPTISSCYPLLIPPSIFPSIRVFSNESALHIRQPKYWSFSISPSNEYSGLISFRIDWFDLLAVQRTLKSLLQHHSLKASILQCSAFFMVQLSHPYMPPGKTTALTIL